MSLSCSCGKAIKRLGKEDKLPLWKSSFDIGWWWNIVVDVSDSGWWWNILVDGSDSGWCRLSIIGINNETMPLSLAQKKD